MKPKIVIFIFCLLILFANLGYAHPHPTVQITGDSDKIIINALHWQDNVDLEYLNNNFVLDDCEITEFTQNTHLKNYEIYITAKHSCTHLKLLNNTLFHDFWGPDIMLIDIDGIDTNQESDMEIIRGEYGTIYLIGYDEDELENKPETKSENFTIGNFKFPNKNFILIPLLILLGIIFSVTGEAISFIIPISLMAKKDEDDKLWLKSGIFHIISTYVFFFLAKGIIISLISKYSFIILVILGASMYLEQILQHLKIPSIIIALIPCPGSLFVAGYLLDINPFMAYLAPLLMGIGELITLRIAKYIPLPKKWIRYTPLAIILIGIGLGIYSLF